MSLFAGGPCGADGAPVMVPDGFGGTFGALPGEGTCEPSGGADMPPVRAGLTTGVAGDDDEPLGEDEEPPEGGAVPPV